MLIQTIKNLIYYKKAKDFYKQYERALMPVAIVFGFVLDMITFRSIDVFTSFILLAIYIVLVGAIIALINIYDARRPVIPGKIIRYVRLWSPAVMQFGFGALLSMSFIFYSFSSVFSVSWPLVLTILFLMIANEIFKDYYKNPSAQLSMFFFVLFTLFALAFPYIFNSVDARIFVFAGVFAILIMIGFIYLLVKFAPVLKPKRKPVMIYILTIFGLMNVLYFLNIVPPIPLSLREMNVSHQVVRAGKNYELLTEKESIWQELFLGKTIHIIKNKPVYVFTSVFSPADLNTEIFHVWQRYDDNKKEWQTINKLSFLLKGGRKDGYRGYSLSNNVMAGKWRVYVETKRGQILGKIFFIVKQVDNLPQMEILRK